jgi:predicted phosphoribosyltransferase
MAEWMEAAQGALSRLDGEQWADKKKATILALVDAHLAGRSEETVWDRPETCARNTYHAKWKHSPTFADVLVEVDGLARGWRDGRSLRALNEAAERLALAAPVAVAKLIERLKSDDEAIILRAAVAILDRAGLETAAKSSSRVDVDMSKLSDAELQAIIGGTGKG